MYSEVYSILKMLGKEYMKKLPKTILKIIIESREENYNPKYDLSIPLKNQDINRKSIAMITLLHYNYWCETQEEKSKLKKMLEENDEKYQKEIKNELILFINDETIKSFKKPKNKDLENKICSERYVFLLNEYKFAIKNIWQNELNNFYDICFKIRKK